MFCCASCCVRLLACGRASMEERLLLSTLIRTGFICRIKLIFTLSHCVQLERLLKTVFEGLGRVYTSYTFNKRTWGENNYLMHYFMQGFMVKMR